MTPAQIERVRKSFAAVVLNLDQITAAFKFEVYFHYRIAGQGCGVNRKRRCCPQPLSHQRSIRQRSRQRARTRLQRQKPVVLKAPQLIVVDAVTDWIGHQKKPVTG